MLKNHSNISLKFNDTISNYPSTIISIVCKRNKMKIMRKITLNTSQIRLVSRRINTTMNLLLRIIFLMNKIVK